MVAASSGPGANAKPGLEHRVVPHLGEEEDVAEQQPGEAGGEQQRREPRERERRARAGARARRPAPGGGRSGAGRRRRGRPRPAKAPEHALVPAPALALGEPEREQADRRDEHARCPSRSGSRVARASRTSGASRSASTIAISPSGMLTRKISRQLTSTSSPPSGGAIEAPTAPIAGPRADHRRALLGREQRQHEPERVRRQRRGADALEHARGHERLDRRRDRAQRRSRA